MGKYSAPCDTCAGVPANSSVTRVAKPRAFWASVYGYQGYCIFYS